MGGRDKGLLQRHGRPIIELLLEQLPDGLRETIISCNRNIPRYQSYARCVSDEIGDYAGPLAGIHAGMATDSEWLLVLPCDCPALPPPLLERLQNAQKAASADICYAHDGHREQYLFCLINTGLRQALADYLARGERSVKGWFREQQSCAVNFADFPQSFNNLNTPADYDDDIDAPA